MVTVTSNMLDVQKHYSIQKPPQYYHGPKMIKHGITIVHVWKTMVKP